MTVPPTVYDIKNVTGNEGSMVILTCKSWGTPAPDMTYLKADRGAPYVMGNNVSCKLILLVYCFKNHMRKKKNIYMYI